MFFQRRTVSGLAIHSYVVGDENTKECVVIDPVRDVEEYITISQQNGLEIKHILETHVHADYVSGAVELKARLNDIPVIHCSGMGGENWTPSYADHVVQDGDEFKVGALTFKASHTPGHTPEHVMWVLSENGVIQKLFTGDFLFVGGVGRPDLLGEEEMQKLSHQLYHSVFSKLDPYPDTTEIRPAHGAGSLCGKALGSAPSSTLGEERRVNKSLKEKSEDVWVADLMKDMPPAPKYFPRMKKVNVVGASIIGEEKPGKRSLAAAELKEEINKGTLVLDVRSKEAFAAAHIPGSINIPVSPQLSTWAGWILPDNVPIALVLDDDSQLDLVVKALIRVGFDKISGFLEGGIWAWEDHAMETDHLKTISSRDLHDWLKEDPEHFVLDVRTNGEWDAGHIDGAMHIHTGLVQNNLEKLPRDRSISVICGSGFRASIVASLLMREGFENISNVFGGMSAWKEEGFPII